MNVLPTVRDNGFQPATLDEAIRLSEILAKSQMVPNAYRNKPEDVFVAVAWGKEIGLAPLQALQNIAVISGKPSVYGDAAMALVQHSPVCEDIEEYFESEGTPNPIAVCVAKRKGRKPVTAKFSVEDAKRAGLWGKSGPWSSYPKRMMQMRARGFALRDAFPDVLKGLITAEEAQDYPTEQATKDITPKGNPLDAVALPKPVDNSVDNVVDFPMSEPVDNSEGNANVEAVEAAAEDAEDVAIHEPAVDEAASEAIENKEYWPLVIPGKADDTVYNSYDEWATAYEELANRVARNGKMVADTKLEKLKQLHDGNKFCLDKVSADTKVHFIQRASERRDWILGGENAGA